MANISLGQIKKIVHNGTEITMPTGGGGDTSAEDGLVDGTLTAYSNDRVTKIRDYTFYYYSSLTIVDFPLVTSVGLSTFQGCSWLTTANLPVATSVGDYAFSSCSSLTTVNLPAATSIGPYAFSSCRSLTTVNLPAATSIGNYAFSSCRSLTTVNLPAATSIGTYAFRYSYSLTTLILRNTTLVCRLASTNAFDNCYHYHGTVHSTYNPDGLKDGYIYVPASLIDSYKVATNWSTLATQFRALEDYTVDGTTTGELDESKI